MVQRYFVGEFLFGFICVFFTELFVRGKGWVARREGKERGQTGPTLLCSSQ